MLTGRPPARRPSTQSRQPAREGMKELRQLVEALHPTTHDDLRVVVERTRAAGLDITLTAEAVPQEAHRPGASRRAGVAHQRDEAQPGAARRRVRDVSVGRVGPGGGQRPRSAAAACRGRFPRPRVVRDASGRIVGAGGSLVVGPNDGGYRVEAELPARATSPAIP